MKTALQLKTSQNLRLTPELQQAIRLLQLSHLELQQEIQQVLESNIMLETEETRVADAKSANDDNATQTVDASASTELNQGDIPAELPVDSRWEDIYDYTPTHTRAAAGDDRYDNFESYNTKERTLDEQLKWQLNLLPISTLDRTIALAIIDSIDDNGYLSCTLEEILTTVNSGGAANVSMEEIEHGLAIVQAMEPVGVGARDIKECLNLQLEQCDKQPSLIKTAQNIVNHYLTLLAKHDYKKLMQKTGLEQATLTVIIDMIRAVNPHPGSQLSASHTEYIVPDVYVRRLNKKWRVELNNSTIPNLKINANYANMIRRTDNSKDNNSLKSHLKEARWFLKSLRSRSETLLQVARCIVEKQRAFFEYGDEAMRPLVLNDIATALAMHESTISRVTTGKYMHTPRGIFELKYFFSSQVKTDDGQATSATAISALIKKLISNEKPSKPLSDQKIVTILAAEGFKVARRTVAKYREAMRIPPSNERRRLS